MEYLVTTVNNFFANLDIVNSGADQIKLTVIFTVLWTYLFFIIQYTVRLPKLDKHNRNDTKNRLVSIVHGLLTFYMSAYCLFVADNVYKE